MVKELYIILWVGLFPLVSSVATRITLLNRRTLDLKQMTWDEYVTMNLFDFIVYVAIFIYLI